VVRDGSPGSPALEDSSLSSQLWLHLFLLLQAPFEIKIESFRLEAMLGGARSELQSWSNTA
jgi:hypothetical protein